MGAILWTKIFILLCLISFVNSQSYTELCCEFVGSPSALQACVENASLKGNANDDSDVVFATIVSAEVYSYASNNLLFNLNALKIHGYHLRILSANTGDDYFPSDRRWNKIYAISVALRTWAKDKRLIVMIDADLVILSESFNVQTIANQYPQANLILAQDSIDVANSGFMIVRNSPWSKEFFAKWWEQKGMLNTFCDQHVLNKLLADLKGTPRQSNVEVIPYYLINSKFPAIENFRDADPVLHLMGETNEVRIAVSLHLAQQLCANAANKGNFECCSSNVAPDSVCCEAKRSAVSITQTQLRELKHFAMMSQWELQKERCVDDSASERDFELLQESIGHMCAPTKRINNSVEFVYSCVNMLQEAYNINTQAMAALPNTLGSVSRKLMHLNQISMVLFDLFELVDSQSIDRVISKDAHKAKFEAAQRVLESLDAIVSIIDINVPHNRAYINHKRGIIFGALSQYHQQYRQYEQSVEKEMIAVSEFSSALEVTLENVPDFAGFVLAYVHSASRLAEAFRQLHRLAEAQEWANIALNNIQILYSSTSNEERLMRAELTNIHSLCASIAADSKDWVLHSKHTSELDKLTRI